MPKNIENMSLKELRMEALAKSQRSMADLRKQAIEKRKRQQIEAEYGGKDDYSGELRAARVGAEQIAAFGARPAVAGAISAAKEEFGRDLPIVGIDEERLEDISKTYHKGRKEALQEQEALEGAYPKSTMAGKFGASLVTAPFMAAKGIGGLAALGGLEAVGESLSEDATLEEAGEKVLTGVATGGAIGAVPVVGKMLAKTKVGTGIKAAAKAAGKTASEFASNITGVNASIVRHYAKNIDKVDSLYKKHGDDFTSAASQITEEILNNIKMTKNLAYSKLGTAFRTHGDDVVNAKQVRSDIMESIAGMNQTFDENAIGEMTELLSKLDNVMDIDGNIKLSDLNAAKKFFYKRANKAYEKDGKFFISADDSQFAAKKAAASAKQILDDVSPEIKEANKVLHLLHKQEERVRGDFLKVGGTEGPLMSAATGAHGRNKNILKRIEEITGRDALSSAKDLAAAREFGAMKLLPHGATGLTTSRQGVLASGGAALGGTLGGTRGAMVGGALGTLLSGPTVTKGVIKTGRRLGQAASLPFTPMGQRSATRMSVDKALNTRTPDNVDPSSAFMGTDGNQTKQAIRKLSSVQDDILATANQDGGTSNFFEALNQSMATQEVEPLMNSLAYYNQNYGVRTSKKIMQAIGGIEGAITKEKLYMALSEVPEIARVQLINDFDSSYQKARSKTPITVKPQDLPLMIKDVSQSKMSNTNKARMINNLTKDGMLLPDLYDEFINGQVKDNYRAPALEKFKRQIELGK